LATSQQYRYDQVREFQTKLSSQCEEYQIKIKKYQRRITAVDITVYSVSGVITAAGIILSSVTMIAPVVVPIAISAVATIAGILTGITKKLSSCSQSKLNDYVIKFHIASAGYSQLSSLISSSLDDTTISDSEFSTMAQLYKQTMLKLEQNNNNNNVVARTTSTNSNKYNTGENKHDISNLNAS
jgi:hypothetical protein